MKQQATKKMQLSPFKPYPRYKDSGVEWLEGIPEHWEVKRLKHFSPIASGFAPPESYDRLTGEYPVYGANGLIGYCEEYLLTQETLVVGRVGASGSVNIVPARSWVSDNALLLRNLKSTTIFTWLRYVLEAMNLGMQASKNAQPIITGTFLGNQPVATPHEFEQRAITIFLDNETAKIDAMVAKKERLIELLQEKRTALITQAVTKGLPAAAAAQAGLDSTVHMKDSGVEWLGEIPEHWEMKRLKFMGLFVGGGTPSKDDPDYWDGNIPWVSPKDMKTDNLDNSEDHITQMGLRESSTHMIPENSVLVVVRSGVLKHTIPVAINTREVALNQDMKAIIPKDEIDPKFLKYLILGNQGPFLGNWRKQGATVESIAHELFINTKLPIPPLDEQKAIVNFVDLQMMKVDPLLTKIQEAINNIKEYRIALISAAVTGKIDVREEGG